MSYNVITGHKEQLVKLINQASNIKPPIAPEEVVFGQPQDGSWTNEGKNYNTIVEMSFLPGGRSDPGVEIPFFYSRTPIAQVVSGSNNTYPIFRDKGPGPFTSHSIIPYINALYGLKITTDDVALTNGIPATTDTYVDSEVHTSVLMDFTPSLRFNGSLTVYFGAALAMNLSSAYSGAADMTEFNESWAISDWAQLAEVTLSGDGFATLSVGSAVDNFKAPGLTYPVNTSNARIVKSDKTKVLLDLWSSVNNNSGWWCIPKEVYINGKRFAYQSHTPFTDVGGEQATVATFVAADSLPIVAVANDYVYIHYGDETLSADPYAD